MERDYADQYLELMRWHWWFRAREQILADVLTRRLPRASGGRRILSVGCGPAPGLRWLAALAGEGGQVVGLDADPSGALRARRELSHADDIQFVGGSFLQPPFRAGAFDAVLALDVVEHVDDDATALREAMRLVRPGGLLMVTVPALPSLWGKQDTISHHKRRYTAGTLSDSFARAGLPTPEITYFNSLLFPAVAGVRWTRRLLGHTDERSDFEDSRPGLVNDVLRRTFALERHVVGRVRLPIGVSLLALLGHAGETVFE